MTFFGPTGLTTRSTTGVTIPLLRRGHSTGRLRRSAALHRVPPPARMVGSRRPARRLALLAFSPSREWLAQLTVVPRSVLARLRRSPRIEPQPRLRQPPVSSRSSAPAAARLDPHPGCAILRRRLLARRA